MISINKVSNSKKIVHFVHLTARTGGIEVFLPLIINSMPQYEFKILVIRRPVTGDANVYDSYKGVIKYGSNNNMKAIYKVFIYAFLHRKEIFHVS